MTKLLRLKDLIEPGTDGRRLVPVSKATLYRLIQAGQFPPPRKIGRASVWTEQDMNAWRVQHLEGANDHA